MFMIYLQAKREQTWNEKDNHLKKKKNTLKSECKITSKHFWTEASRNYN